MKNSVLNSMKMRLIFVSILFAGLSFFTSSNLNAQTGLTDGFYAVPQGNFVPVSVALIRLDNALQALKIEMEALPPGSHDFLLTEVKYIYFDNIRTILLDGKGTNSAAVAAAIAGGLHIFSTDLYGNYSKQIKGQIKQSAIDLLKQ